MKRGVDYVALSQTTYARTLRRDLAHADRHVEFTVQPSRYNFLRAARRASRAPLDPVERLCMLVLAGGVPLLAAIGAVHYFR